MISEAAINLIVAEEVTSQATYERKYRRPEWPGYSSGVTIGIGYDVCYSTPNRLRSDWAGLIPAPMIDGLSKACGVGGKPAQQLAHDLQYVDVPWSAAMDVFKRVDVPRWVTTVRNALPNTDKLSLDSLGALVSLTYNRGASFDKTSSDEADRFREMRAIKAHMAAQAFDKIPGELRKMKRLWPGSGLVARREREAVLFEKGLLLAPAAPVSNAENGHPKAAAPETTNPVSSLDEAKERATKNERTARNGGAATSTVGASHEAAKVSVMPQVLAWSAIGIGIVVVIVAAYLIVKKRQAVAANWK